MIKHGLLAELQRLIDDGLDPNARILEGKIEPGGGEAKPRIIGAGWDHGGGTMTAQKKAKAKKTAAKIRAKDDFRGGTLLHVAVSRGDISLIKILLKNGANKELKNDAGCTPLQVAKRKKKKAIVKLLLK